MNIIHNFIDFFLIKQIGWYAKNIISLIFFKNSITCKDKVWRSYKNSSTLSFTIFNMLRWTYFDTFIYFSRTIGPIWTNCKMNEIYDHSPCQREIIIEVCSWKHISFQTPLLYCLNIANATYITKISIKLPVKVTIMKQLQWNCRIVILN